MSLTLVLPPLTQLNTPYPSISYLANYLRGKGVPCSQRDLGIELVLKVFSRPGLEDVFKELEEVEQLPEPAWRALSLQRTHLSVIDGVVAYLQGKDSSLATRIVEGSFLPAGPRIQHADLRAFGMMGTGDAARYMSTLYLADLADLVTSCIDDGFALARYQAHLATAAASFDPLWDRLQRTTLIDRYLDELGDSLDSDIVGLSVPFPGNLYGALRLGKRLRGRGIYVVMGGGYINTELREVNEHRLWQCVDAITYDDGEGPLDAILQFRTGGNDTRHRTRTEAQVFDMPAETPKTSIGAFYGELNLGQYLQTIDTLNPAHRLWADGRWNKITLAHGCYWKRCAFCDVSLDYIGRYEAAPICDLVDHMEETIRLTGQRGFHFVDEAAPPKLLRDLAIEILRRNLTITMWGNIRFEKSYDEDLCRLLAAAGLIAVTGGLEVANERLLRRIDKGVSVEQVARCAASFQSAGVMVHAYLMYGFPTQTVQESIDSMELVRQLFAAGLIDSGFWHRFVLTRHAPIYSDPDSFGVQLVPLKSAAFAQNDVPHVDPSGGDHDLFDEVLPGALESWLRGQELALPVHKWFPSKMPRTKESPTRISDALNKRSQPRRQARVLWIGGEAIESEAGLSLHTADGEVLIEGRQKEIAWLAELLDRCRPAEEAVLLSSATNHFPGNWQAFGQRWSLVRELGLLLV